METKGKTKLLLIDDDPDFVEAYKRYLAGFFDVQSALDGDSGLRMISERRPEAVLLDLRMPRVSGVEVLETMQKRPDLRAIPVIVLTGQHLDEKTRRELGAMANVCQALEKSAPPAQVCTEAERAALLGELYRETPELRLAVAPGGGKHLSAA